MNPSHPELEAFLTGAERRALRMAQIVTQDRDEALDIVQDAMVQLARKYAQHPPQEWPPLFYRIVENKIRDWRRRQMVRNRIFFWRAPNVAVEDEEVSENQPDQQATGADLLQRDQAMHQLEAALRKLPNRQREVFDLRIWQGLSVEETALAMGCSEGSVKTHLFRALATLRADLKGVWP
ncbi:RNA polymerase sigma factor [Stenotrophobium rhamnosiphilum]|uniref:RNA polymerase sigma factor n=1 Tax=Stenotrophobium rhamnosiphilum TaxID=2029166 RepID=A0A2T5MFU3_9GAMM|nr:RNA polymerase sigma factor [Stenotrophobium rhamnosiphilum]PTU31443.1 RNA polymerase sigma factor [Stenotrophobium rhamnosiphilum]